MESPFLLKREAVAIAAVTDKQVQNFVDTDNSQPDKERLSIKSIDGTCFFYKDGRCTIYKNRPLDCRLFPFDIIEDNNGNLFWTVYENLCPPKFDYTAYFDIAKQLMAKSGYNRSDLRDFASHGAEVMRQHKHHIIEPVVI